MLCVGLDPDPKRIPAHLAGHSQAIFEFCRQIVDATAAYVCAFKPQIAYFAAHGAETQLELLIDHVHRRHPQIPVILDAKRGDIGSTAEQYAVEAFERFDADALTVNPYLGFDSIEPYLRHRGRGVIVLCRTSNTGGAQFQMLASDGERLYERIARLAATDWHSAAGGQLGLVVGATAPAELARVRALAPELPLLVPGIGAQGGDPAAVVGAGADRSGFGLIVNSSRAILYCDDSPDFAAAAAAVAKATRDELNRARLAARAGA